MNIEGDGIDGFVISLYETRWSTEPWYVIFGVDKGGV